MKAHYGRDVTLTMEVSLQIANSERRGEDGGLESGEWRMVMEGGE
jgi:hypothetical protein